MSASNASPIETETLTANSGLQSLTGRADNPHPQPTGFKGGMATNAPQ